MWSERFKQRGSGATGAGRVPESRILAAAACGILAAAACRILAAAACGILAAAALLTTSGAAAARTPAPPSHLLVYAQEWSLWPSRGSVPAGTVVVELWNRGQDAHDLRIRRLGRGGQMVGRVLGAVRTTSAGAIGHATWRLQVPGRYQLYCSLPGHAALGMDAELTVTRL